MKLLQKSFVELRLKPVIHAIGYLTISTREIIEKKTGLCQGRSVCRKCYSSLCRSRTQVAESCSQDGQNPHQHSLKLFSNSPLYLYIPVGHSININRRVHCQHMGMNKLNKTQIRSHNTYSCSNYGQCMVHCSTDLSNCGNCAIWQHIQSRGMKSGRDKVGHSDDEILNPIDRLQQFVAVPLLPEKDFIFRPSEEEVAEAQKLFIPGPKHNIEFLKSAVFEKHLPDYNLPEVAFIGRSNVGKSSLIQMLLSHTDVLVRVSKTPGHTKLLNFFKVGKMFTLVDMPGYGYNMPEHYASSVEHFLSSRKKLSRTFVLVDSTTGVTENDVIGLNMLEEFHIPYVMTFLLIDGHGPNTVDAERFEMINSMNIDYCVVMTKIDKAKPSTLLKSFMTVLKYRDKTQHCFPQPFLVSSKNGEGIPLLQTFIAYVTGCVSVEGL